MSTFEPKENTSLYNIIYKLNLSIVNLNNNLVNLTNNLTNLTNLVSLVKNKKLNKEKEECEEKKQISEKKERYGQDSLVLLTSLEVKKLKEVLGDDQFEYYVANLNDYLAQTGTRKYKSHYHTILVWYKKDLSKSQQPKIGEAKKWL